jgi:hypothetical protein
MRLKDFLELIRTDECISIYDPLTNVYLSHEKFKEDYKGEYDNCIVTCVTTDLDQGYNPVLEIQIFAQ